MNNPSNDAARPACYITEELLADMDNQQRGTATVIAADRPRRGDNWVALYTAADYDALRAEGQAAIDGLAQCLKQRDDATASAEAAKEKARAFRDALWVHVQARETGDGATCTQADINADLTVKRVEDAAALNEGG